MAYHLVRVHGDEDWDTIGEDWWDRLDLLGELHEIDGYYIPPQWLRERGSRQLDWGAFLYEVSKHEILRLLRPLPDYSDIRDDWDAPFRKLRQQGQRLIDTLDPNARYGIVWTEIW